GRGGDRRRGAGHGPAGERAARPDARTARLGATRRAAATPARFGPGAARGRGPARAAHARPVEARRSVPRVRGRRRGRPRRVAGRFLLGPVRGVAAGRHARQGELDPARDEFALAEDATVRLAHPLHLGDAVAAWSELFADYEILQP